MHAPPYTFFKVVFGEVLEGMDIVHAIGTPAFPTTIHETQSSPRITEDVAKGRNDRPDEDIIIADCGELEVKSETTATEQEVPTHAEL